MSQDRQITVDEFLEGMPDLGISYFANLCLTNPSILAMTLPYADTVADELSNVELFGMAYNSLTIH